MEEQARRLREIPRLVEEYLTDLPYLIDRMPVIREYETVPPEDGSLPIYTLTPERIRYKDEELGSQRRDALDRSLEIRWGGVRSEWRRGTSACCRA